jgi:hypothetical protein
MSSKIVFYLQEFCHILTELTKQSDLGNGNILPQTEKYLSFLDSKSPPPPAAVLLLS